jgi:predicted RNA-binding Zn-ribbon protein involved in translation (DUF1610 family)
MAQYAKKECPDCGIILPRDQLYPISIESHKATLGSGGSVRFGKGRNPLFGIYSKRKIYTNKIIYICSACKNVRDEYAKQQLIYGFCGFILFVFLIWWMW